MSEIINNLQNKVAALTQTVNQLLSGSKSIPELPAQTTLDGSSLLHTSRGGVSEKISVQQIVNAAVNNDNDQILSIGAITLASNNLTIASISGKINNVVQSIPTPTVVNIPYCATGLNRIDLIVYDGNNNILRIAGTETAGSIIVAPTLPLETLLVNQISVSDSVIGDTSSPILGSEFIKKQYDKFQVFTGTGTDVVIPLNASGISNIYLEGAMTSISGLDFTELLANPTSAEYPHEGKSFMLFNRSGHNITLKHSDTLQDVWFVLSKGVDLVIPNNEKVFFKCSSNVFLEVDKSWVNPSDVLGDLTTDALPQGSTNLYFTTARVLSTALTAISFATGGSIVSTDTILQAFGKIQKQINDLSSVFVPQTRTITIGGVTQDLSANRTFSGGSLPKTELYKRHYEAYDTTTGSNFLGSYNNAGLQEIGRGAFDYSLIAWPYNTPNTVGGVAYTIFHNTLNIPTQFSETNLTKIKGFYSLMSFKLTNYASTSQRFLFGLKRDNVAFSNINPSTILGDSLFSVGRDSGDANFSFFIKPDSGAILKIDTGIAYNIQETITLEVERPSGGVSGYMKITTSETRATFTYNIANMKNLWAINNGGGINNATSTDIVGYYIFVNKMYKEL